MMGLCAQVQTLVSFALVTDTFPTSANTRLEDGKMTKTTSPGRTEEVGVGYYRSNYAMDMYATLDFSSSAHVSTGHTHTHIHTHTATRHRHTHDTHKKQFLTRRASDGNTRVNGSHSITWLTRSEAQRAVQRTSRCIHPAAALVGEQRRTPSWPFEQQKFKTRFSLT